MSVWDDAQAFLQGEVGKFLQIPTTLQTITTRIQALQSSGKSDPAQLATWTAQVQDAQGRYQQVAVNVNAIVAAVQQAGGASGLSLDQSVTLGAQLLQTGGQVVGLLGDVSNVDAATQQAYYGAGFTSGVSIPWWVWVAGAAAVLAYLKRRKRGR